MTRKLRPLALKDLGRLPCVCEGCTFWETPDRLEPRCGVACNQEALSEWYKKVIEEWGECGRVATEDDEILGFIKYAPGSYLPQANHFPAGVPNGGAAPMLACIHIRDDAKRHGLGRLLLHAALRDLTLRGERTVYAYAAAGHGDVTYRPVIGVEFLMRHGFTVSNAHPEYPLLKIDLRSLVSIAENLDAVFQSLRIPIRQPQVVPSPSIKSERGPLL